MQEERRPDQAASWKCRQPRSNFVARAGGIGELQSDGVRSCWRSRAPRRPKAAAVHSAQKRHYWGGQWMRKQRALGAQGEMATVSGAAMLDFDLGRGKRAGRLCLRGLTASAGVAGDEAGPRKTIECRLSQNHSGEDWASVRRLVAWELWTEHHRLRRAGDGRKLSDDLSCARWCYRQRVGRELATMARPEQWMRKSPSGRYRCWRRGAMGPRSNAESRPERRSWNAAASDLAVGQARGKGSETMKLARSHRKKVETAPVV